MPKHPALAAFAAAALLAVPLQALAYDSHGPESRLIEKYDRFAGSDRNARELVTGLRNDSQIDLSKGGKTTSFKPATGAMGYGNVDLALGLAKTSLAEHGIHNPTPEQIRAALNGGSVTTKSGQRVALPGVLKLRASGMGWGQIAHRLDVKVGDVKNHGHKHAKQDHKHDRPDWKHDKHERKHEHVKHHHQRPEVHRVKFERPERGYRPEKVERPHRPERPERPERHHHRR